MKQVNQSDLPLGVVLNELTYEAAFEVRGMLVVVSTNDMPHEETLFFHLYDADNTLCDCVELYGAYSPGLFELHSTSDRYIEFSFWSEELLRLVFVHPPKRVWKKPWDVRYPDRFARHYLFIEKLNS